MMKTMATDIPTAVEYLRLHKANVQTYREFSAYASAGYPNPLTEDQAEAYKILPSLMDNCRASWEIIPPELRPDHYLLSC